MATCHHLSGATWCKHYSPTVGQSSVNRRRTTGQRWSTTAVNGGQHRQTTGQRQRSTVADLRWTTVGPPVNGGGQQRSTVADHRWTTVGPPPDHRSMVVDRRSSGSIVGSWAGSSIGLDQAKYWAGSSLGHGPGQVWVMDRVGSGLGCHVSPPEWCHVA
ncbi:hypothetical protein Tco_1257433 [Tanacetum coccineum]